MIELFTVSPKGSKPLALDDERELLAAAKRGDQDAQWQLLFQYRGALQSAIRMVDGAGHPLGEDAKEELRSDLVVEALSAIQDTDWSTTERLAQVLPRRLRAIATERVALIVVPRSTLSRWFRVLRAADGDQAKAELMAPSLEMSAQTFRSIAAALDNTDSEWALLPYNAGQVVPDQLTLDLAHQALDFLTPAERDVIELCYGFRGDPKTDEEVSEVRMLSRRTVKEQRTGALHKMRAGLTGSPDKKEEG